MAGNTPNLTPYLTQASDNPFDMASKGVSLKNALLQNNIAQSAYKAKLAVGKAIADNTDSNGNINHAGIRAQLAQNPDAQYDMSSSIKEDNENRSGDLRNDAGQIDLANKQKDNVMSTLSTVYSNPSDLNLKAHAMFLATQHPELKEQIQKTTDTLLSMPEDARKGAIASSLNSMQSPDKQQENVTGRVQNFDDGSQIIAGTQNAMTGSFTPSNTVSKQLSPESNAEIRTRSIIGPDGRPHTVYDTAGGIRSSIQGASGYGNPSNNSNDFRINTGYTARNSATTDANQNAIQPNYVDAVAPTGSVEQYQYGRDVSNKLNSDVENLPIIKQSLSNLESNINNYENDPRFKGMSTASNLLNAAGLGDGEQKTITELMHKNSEIIANSLAGPGATDAQRAAIKSILPEADGSMTIGGMRAVANMMHSIVQHREYRDKLATQVQDKSQLPEILASFDRNYAPEYFAMRNMTAPQRAKFMKENVTTPQQKKDLVEATQRMASLQKQGRFDYGIDKDDVDVILGLAKRGEKK